MLSRSTRSPGKTQTELHASHQFREQKHIAKLIGVARTREALDARIEARTARWLAGGWIEEVRDLLERGYRDARAMDSVGYRQVRMMLDGELPSAELHQEIVRATRRFVRRQRTWLRDLDVEYR